ncbi:endonuclease/exonuclease/phosphatase family protein [Aquidulcibacter sp.]|uniref:endonuclease/exonuclease/phosphatase family protein n=1 Tax=Aquidulcibacter sp. TaxID=2052990 RepID=UPI0025BCF47B|nr:endonuclease/exonuclease/phosphatase family protein [Aquidulcibacter sp.]MCA3692576.1 hypothetical protein [Aquidulcibacter sp.]
MAKPILRLGPVDELDDEFDPLLGRTVRDEPMPVATSPAAPLDPDQSIFDEPEPVVAPSLVEAASQAPAKPTKPSDQPSLLDWMENPVTDKTSSADAVEVLEAEIENQREVQNDPEPVEWVQDVASPVEADAATHEAEPQPEATMAEPVPEAATPLPPSEQIERVDEVAQASCLEENALLVEPKPEPEMGSPRYVHIDEPVAVAEAREFDAPSSEPDRPPFHENIQAGAAATVTARGLSRAAQRRATMKRSPIGRRKAAQKLAATVAGTTLFAVALFFTLLSFLAPLGYPFDAVSSYRWYWTLLALAAGLSWAVVRGRTMMIASALVGAINLLVVVPALGAAPKGGQISNAVVAWANVAGEEKALERVLSEAERQKAGLVLIAKAPRSVVTPPSGWKLIEAPNFADPTSIAVLSRGRWQSSTIPGEPTIARTAAGDLTIIATLPPPSSGGNGAGAARESQLNRAAVRAGDQDGPVAVLGDFGVAPWDGAMSQFRKYGNVTRVRCGGFMGTTVSQAFGLIGVTHDHAYVRDVKVTHCRLGSSLAGGGHRAIYLYLAPLDTAK